MRSLSVANRNAINANQVQIIWLVRLVVSTTPNDPLYLASTAHTIHWAGLNWLGAGELLNIDFAEEDASLEAKAGEITLNGLNPALINMAMNSPLEGSVVHIWCMLRDPDSSTPIDFPFVMCRATVSEVRITQPMMGGDE